MQTENGEQNISRDDLFIKQILVVIYILLVLLLSFLFRSPLPLIFVGTLPLFLHTLMIYFAKVDKHNAIMRISLVSIVIHLIYLAMWKNQSFAILSEMNVPVLFVFNLLISYVFNAIMLYKNFVFRSPNFFKRKYDEYIKRIKLKSELRFRKIEDEHKAKSQKYKAKIQDLQGQLEYVKPTYDVTKSTLKFNLRGIEDKCKAINFVIGRVYSNKRGASADIRDIIKIDSELYNSFSEITMNFDSSQALVLLNVLERLYRKLLLFELPENQVFVLTNIPKTHVERDNEGNDRIIDVMTKNDKDPIMEYYYEAKEICVKLIDFLKQEYRI